MQIVREAAINARVLGSSTIAISGHADAHEALVLGVGRDVALRRANKVAEALGRFGITGSGIAVSGFGNNRPLVPQTNVSPEPQNRRVEIVIQ